MAYIMYYNGCRYSVKSISVIKNWMIKNAVRASDVIVYKRNCLQKIDIGTEDKFIYENDEYYFNDYFNRWMRIRKVFYDCKQKKVFRHEPMCKDVLKEDGFRDKNRINKTYRALKEHCWEWVRFRSRKADCWKNKKVRKQYMKHK